MAVFLTCLGREVVPSLVEDFSHSLDQKRTLANDSMQIEPMPFGINL